MLGSPDDGSNNSAIRAHAKILGAVLFWYLLLVGFCLLFTFFFPQKHVQHLLFGKTHAPTFNLKFFSQTKVLFEMKQHLFFQCRTVFSFELTPFLPVRLFFCFQDLLRTDSEKPTKQKPFTMRNQVFTILFLLFVNLFGGQQLVVTCLACARPVGLCPSLFWAWPCGLGPQVGFPE